MKIRLINKKVILLIATVISILIFILWRYKAWELVSIDHLKEYRGKIKELGVLGILLYLLVFIIGTIFCLPSLPFALLGGITYGTVKGTIYASIGDVLGSSTAFIIGRYLLKERIEKKLKNNKTFHEINKGVQKDGWRIVVLTRMVPLIPHWLQNYAYGITAISFKTYALVSLICAIPGTAAWIFAINTVGKNKEDAKTAMIYLSISAVIIVAVSYLPRYIYKNKLSKK